jgi:epoxyqueuosine reductase
MKTVSELETWLEREVGIQCFKLPYHVERGGVYLKDAAVLAGLGCIGKNNLLVTPQYGPRLRLRGMLTDSDLPSTGVIGFDPCIACPMPCRTSCPQAAFARQRYTRAVYELEALPARSGAYDRFRCNRQMERDESNYMAEETVVHVRDEFSTWGWVMEGLLERAGFRIDRDFRIMPHIRGYLCSKQK